MAGKAADGFNGAQFLAPGPGKCRVCAGAHDAQQPHNKDSLYYRMKFRQEHGRYPNWEDAMAHCPPGTKAWWREELLRRGIDLKEVRKDEKSGYNGEATAGADAQRERSENGS